MTHSIIRSISRERKNSNSGWHLKWNLKEGRQNNWPIHPQSSKRLTYIFSHIWCPWRSSLASADLEATRDIRCISIRQFSALHFFHIIPVAYRAFCILHSCQVSCQAELVYSRSCWQLSPRACCHAVNLAKLSCIYFFFLQSFLEISILENSVFPHKVLAANLSSYLILCSTAIWENRPGRTVHL